jgi:hypothetical protein
MRSFHIAAIVIMLATALSFAVSSARQTGRDTRAEIRLHCGAATYQLSAATKSGYCVSEADSGAACYEPDRNGSTQVRASANCTKGCIYNGMSGSCKRQ